MPLPRIVFWVATALAMFAIVHTLVVGPPSAAVAVSSLVLYVTVVMSGIFFLRLEMFADVVYRSDDQTDSVVLTFDDGPHPEHTRAILAVLERYQATATFFVIGAKAERHPEVVREIQARGHDLGVHGFTHDRLFSLRRGRRVERDLRRAIDVLERITGVRPELFRPPVGHTSMTMARVVSRLGLTVIGWSVAGRDGVRTSADAVVRRVQRGLVGGAIVLLHDASERDDRVPASIEALPKILDEIAARKLRVAPLSAFLDLPQADGKSTTKRAPPS